MNDLRQKLVDAKLAGHKLTAAEDGRASYSFNTNETAADLALAVFRDWLRSQDALLDAATRMEAQP